VTALPSIILSWISSSLCLTWYKALSTSFLVSILLIRALTFFLPISSILLFRSSILDLEINIASLSSGMAFFMEISTMDLSNLIWISILEFALNILASFSIFKALLKSKSFSILSLSPFMLSWNSIRNFISLSLSRKSRLASKAFFIYLTCFSCCSSSISTLARFFNVSRACFEYVSKSFSICFLISFFSIS